ncbi:DoxX family membrane protein [Bacteriovorax sp. Seq25_V]|uniref:DoxX family membrane protein n=1 Tax=Bacteriovorax sp. Seq25_V TaxID=1201288 RepID=UPI00038A0049|nr:DoxX family protein [Bacteriovorax sp. Seq25_V]EQC45539.1 DoxX family protein [Bacteriovorax sp. Seq25_V]
MKDNIKEWTPVIARSILGAIFLISGTNNFMSFLPEQQYTPEGLSFILALKESGYLFTLIKAMEVLCGSMLLFNLFTPFVMIIIAPIIVNIFLFELILSDSYMILPTVLVVLEAYLFYEYKNLFIWLFKYQVHTHTNDNKPPEILILDQLKEENPQEYSHLIHAKGVNKIILR